MTGPGRIRPLVSRLLPDAFWTLLNNLAPVVGGLAVVKLISAFVPPTDYGEVSLALGVVALLTQLVAAPLLTAHQRLWFDHVRTGTTGEFLRSIEPALLRCAAVMAGLYLLIAIGYRAAGHPGYLRLAIPALILAALQPHVNAALNLLEASRRYKVLAYAQSLLRAAPAILLAGLLALPLPRSTAVVLAQALAFGLVALVYSRSAIRGASLPRADAPSPSLVQADGMESRTGTASSVLAPPGPGDAVLGPEGTLGGGFGGALFVFNLVSWVMTTSDRYLLEQFWSQDEVGVYAINYGFWSMPYLMLNGWLETFTRSRLYARAVDSDRAGMRRIVLARLGLASSLGIAGTLLLFVLGPPIARFLLGETYFRGMTLAMVVACAHLTYAIGNSFHGLLIATKRADILLRAAALSAAVSVGSNLCLLPRMGILGAAVSAFASFLTWTVFLLLKSRPLLSHPNGDPAARG